MTTINIKLPKKPYKPKNSTEKNNIVPLRETRLADQTYTYHLQNPIPNWPDKLTIAPTSSNWLFFEYDGLKVSLKQSKNNKDNKFNLLVNSPDKQFDKRTQTINKVFKELLKKNIPLQSLYKIPDNISSDHQGEIETQDFSKNTTINEVKDTSTYGEKLENYNDFKAPDHILALIRLRQKDIEDKTMLAVPLSLLTGKREHLPEQSPYELIKTNQERDIDVQWLGVDNPLNYKDDATINTSFIFGLLGTFSQEFGTPEITNEHSEIITEAETDTKPPAKKKQRI